MHMNQRNVGKYAAGRIRPARPHLGRVKALANPDVEWAGFRSRKLGGRRKRREADGMRAAHLEFEAVDAHGYGTDHAGV